MANAVGEPAAKAGSHGFSEVSSEGIVDRSIAVVVELRDIARLDDDIRRIVGRTV